jgi:hypothetical protein
MPGSPRFHFLQVDHLVGIERPAAGGQNQADQGVWIVSPDDKVLAGDDYGYKDAPKLLAGMDAALKAFGPVETRKARREEPFPFRGVGVRPDGSVDLALYRCYLHQGKPDGPHLRDTLSLKREEWTALTPPRLVAGTEWVIAEDVARKLVRPFCLNTLGGDMPGPEDAKVARLIAKVEAVKDQDHMCPKRDGVTANARSGAPLPSRLRLCDPSMERFLLHRSGNCSRATQSRITTPIDCPIMS